ncbi:MAG: glycosyltransferase family 4 protein [Pirellulales bacterium]|nr:glycosyltransferase family 4 protein [Pirellulales bacterium]
MKIVFVDRRAAVSIWSLMNQVARGLIARGDEVIFCRLDDQRPVAPPPAPEGVDVVDVPVRRKRGMWDLFWQHKVFSAKFGDLLREWTPDVVHTHFCVPGIIARLIAHRRRTPVILSTQHETYGSMRPHYRWAVRHTERFVSSVVYVSWTVANSFGRAAHTWSIAEGNVAPRHLVVHNGVDLAEIDQIRNNAALSSPNKVVCIGRLVPVKGQRLLLQAMPRVLKACPDTRLVLIGSGPDEVALRSRASQLHIAERVDFKGWLSREESIHELATAAAVVVPSRRGQEGFGLVVAEAMACQTPVVASRIDVFEELLGCTTDAGWFFEEGDPGSLAETLIETLRSPAEAARRAANARRRVERRFTVDHMVANYLRLYDFLVGTKKERFSAGCHTSR